MKEASKVSNSDLELQLKALVKNERKLLHLILQHIYEVDIRRVYLDRAYPSLYEYLTSELGYSGSAAMRRIEGARLLHEVPAMGDLIQAGEFNLSQIGEVARAVREKEKTGAKVSPLQKRDLVIAVSGKTTQETQRELAVSLDLEILQPEKQRVQKDDSLRLEMTLSSAQVFKLRQCRDLLSHRMLRTSLDSSWSRLIEALADQYLKKNLNQDVKSFTTASETVRVNCPASRPAASPKLSPKMRWQVLHRQRACQYVDSRTGKKCGSTFNLEVDHKIPQWAGGGHDPGNLQVLCRAHNNLKYRNESGITLKGR